MLKAPRDKAALVDPDEWWTERRVLSRELVDHGDIKTAYTRGRGTFGRGTGQHRRRRIPRRLVRAARLRTIPRRRPSHFARIAEVAEGPISQSRAYYWLGRAAEAGGPGNATAYYQKAAVLRHHLLRPARRRAHRQQQYLDGPTPTRAAADRRISPTRGGPRRSAGSRQCGYASLADTSIANSPADGRAPANLRCSRRWPRSAATISSRCGSARSPLQRGLDIGALSHPVGVIPASANISGAGKALAYAIARQESEFNVGAVSGAGARGLLQLLPGTAKEVARKAGMTYSKERLTTDAGYNATLGAAFLGEQLGRFDGSYVLTFAGYNAGPRRAQEWVKQYGDPRGKDIDAVVDWIERIPFTETRSYVQRVMENYQVYKMRLSGKFDIVDDLVNGR